jgi:pilus assembly protein Flp/PilA
MRKMTGVDRAFLDSEEGVTSIEYALLGALIAVAIIFAVANVGSEVERLYTYVSDQVDAAVGDGG